jgi:hypothetical protein
MTHAYYCFRGFFVLVLPCPLFTNKVQEHDKEIDGGGGQEKEDKDMGDGERLKEYTCWMPDTRSREFCW